VTNVFEIDVLLEDDQSIQDRYLKESRPPLLKDYFDPQLIKVAPVPRQNWQVRIIVGVEMGPAAAI
jgi:hypothetical protein